MKVKFKAYDKINEKEIDIWQINISKDGDIMSVRSLDGELYGLHQIELSIFQEIK